MAMNLYVLRHGLAGSWDSRRYPDDTLRPLTRKGTDRMWRAAEGMSALGIRPGLIISSPLLRAVQTADIVRRGLGIPAERMINSAALVPSAHPSQMLDALAENHASETRVMVVGHEPHMSSLVSFVMTGRAQPIINFKKGALCNLRLDPSGRGRLLWSLTQRQLMKLA